jgi:CubicO group peptidase (beta-lactamase class C family)
MKLSQEVAGLIGQQHFDSIAVGIINFKNNVFETTRFLGRQEASDPDALYFDLASITKPLVLATAYLKKSSSFSKEQLLLLEHRAGLCSGGRLGGSGWRDYISSLEIKESSTLYSDYSALRLQIELEKEHGSLYDLAYDVWDKNVLHWGDLSVDEVCAPTGYRRGRVICGEVHDDNAYYLGERLSHAGLFGTVGGLCQTMINLNEKLSLIKTMQAGFKKREHANRFLWGWDTVENPDVTLAGKGCSKNTFGHLGFTGTSVWVDTDKEIGCVVLTNGTQNYWYDRKNLNNFRRSIGELCWNERFC